MTRYSVQIATTHVFIGLHVPATLMGSALPFPDKKSFVQLADLLNIQVITLKIRSHPLGQWMPRVYQSAASRFLRSMVRHR